MAESQIYSKTLLDLQTPEARIKHTLQCIELIERNALALKSYPQAIPQINRHHGCMPKDKIHSYLNSIRFCDRKELLSVRVADLKLFYSDLDPISMVALSAAEVQHIPFIQWFCSYCAEPFFDSNSHQEHVFKFHVGCLPPELEAVMPNKPNCEWLNLSERSGWSAFDEPFRHKIPTHSMAERNEILDRIHKVFLVLLNHNILAASHIHKMVELATAPLYSVPLKDIEVMVKETAKSNECIRYSSGTQLIRILDFLVEIGKLDHGNRTKEILEDRFILDPNEVAFLMEILHNEVTSPRIDNVARDAKSLYSWLYESTVDDDYMVTRNQRLFECRSSIHELQVHFSLLCRLCEDKQIFLNACDNLEMLRLQELERHKQVLAATKCSQNIEYDVILDIAKNSSALFMSRLEQLSWQILYIDARIMSSRSTIRKLTRKMGHLAVHDCRTVLMQLVKFFIKFQLQDRIDRDGRDKSEARVQLHKAQTKTCAEQHLRSKVIEDMKERKSSLEDPVKAKRKPVLEVVGVAPQDEAEQEHVCDDVRMELSEVDVQFEPPVVEAEELPPPAMSNKVLAAHLNGEEAQGDYFCTKCQSMSGKLTEIYLNARKDTPYFYEIFCRLCNCVWKTLPGEY